jgi:hypothetical protein
MREAQETSGIGRISFGCFSLSAQRKVSRPWVRGPTLKLIVAIVTQLCSWFDKLTMNGYLMPMKPTSFINMVCYRD